MHKWATNTLVYYPTYLVQAHESSQHNTAIKMNEWYCPQVKKENTSYQLCLILYTIEYRIKSYYLTLLHPSPLTTFLFQKDGTNIQKNPGISLSSSTPPSHPAPPFAPTHALSLRAATKASLAASAAVLGCVTAPAVLAAAVAAHALGTDGGAARPIGADGGVAAGIGRRGRWGVATATTTRTGVPVGSWVTETFANSDGCKRGLVSVMLQKRCTYQGRRGNLTVP